MMVALLGSLMPTPAQLFWLVEGFVGFDGAPIARFVSLWAGAPAAAWCYLVRRIFQTITLPSGVTSDYCDRFPYRHLRIGPSRVPTKPTKPAVNRSNCLKATNLNLRLWADTFIVGEDHTFI
jgi:hypothetical protein